MVLDVSDCLLKQRVLFPLGKLGSNCLVKLYTTDEIPGYLIATF